MENPICVLQGEWRCLEDGEWKFELTKGVMARSIIIRKTTTYTELCNRICVDFDIEPLSSSIKLSYWCPVECDVCTQTKMPPLAMTNDYDLEGFKKRLLEGKKLNIFMSEQRNMANNNLEAMCVTSPVDDLDSATVIAYVDAIEKQYEKSRYQQQTSCQADEVTSSSGETNSNLVALMKVIDREQEAMDSAEAQQCPTICLDESLGSQETEILNHDDGDIIESAFADENIDPQFQYSVDVNDSLFEDPTPDIEYISTVSDDKELYVGRVFGNKSEFKTFIAKYALDNQFCYDTKKSDKSRVIFVCIDDNCSWRVYAVSSPPSPCFEIRTVIWSHTCGVQSRARYGKKATKKVLGNLLQEKFANGKKGPRACELPDIVLSEMNLTISYMQAWMAKEVAVANARGKEEDSFNLLETYLKLLCETNPGTLTNVETMTNPSGMRYFKYLFVAFGASIAGWKYLRKVIVIDGTQIKGKYKGCLVAASCQDGNMQIFPLAFGYVDSENEPSWVWFLEKLAQIVPDDPALMFVSDRHQSIYAALRRVYPLSKHGACVVHLFRNVKHRYKCEGLASLVSRAARAYTRPEFAKWWTEIEGRSPECAQYLRDIGLPHWTRAYCHGERYNLMSSNISESLNNAIKKAVDYPIVTMLEYIRTMLMRWYSCRREKAEKCPTPCTPEIEKILVSNLHTSTNYAVLQSGQWMYQVNDGKGNIFAVDLDTKKCSCKVFESLKIPCSHAIAACKVKSIDVYSLVDNFYTRGVWAKVYEQLIMPVPKTPDMDLYEDKKIMELLPPKTRRPAGRPKTKRIPSQGEYSKGPRSKRGMKCGRCGEGGHNKTSCKNAI